VNVLFVTVDSLRRDFVGAYRDRPRVVDYPVATDTIDAFAERSTVTTFANHYAGSLPCMPARREFLAGVREFLWRPWGPAEPFDDLLPALAGAAGATTALVTDHYHYFEAGGERYWTDYDGFEFVRGHEHDHWKTAPADPDPELLAQLGDRDPEPYARNVAGLDPTDETAFFAARTFSTAADWVRDNAGDHDDWFLYVDSFDVHEPFHNPEPYASMYTDEDPRDPELAVWPDYDSVAGQGMTARELAFVRSQFAGKVTMADRWLDELFDALGTAGAWEETVVVLTTDHGYALGDHGQMAKNHQPTYDEIAHTPLLIHHPDGTGGRVTGLTSAVDVYPTLLAAIGGSVPDGHGTDLLAHVTGDRDPADGRDYALYGYFGAGINVTDGQYTYLHPAPTDAPVALYSAVQPPGADDDAEPATLPYADPPVWRYERPSTPQNETPLLFDVEADPEQTEDLTESRPGEHERLRDLLVAGLDALSAPASQYERLGLS